jgi:FkbM family methyltransferase
LKNIVLFLYAHLPKSIIHILGKNKWLKHIRYLILRPNGLPLLTKESIFWNDEIAIQFEAPIKIALKAKNQGLENSLLKHTLQTFKNRQDLVILDIGASFGFLSLIWAKTLASKGKVYSFEPHPLLFQQLSKNIAYNQLQFICNPINALVGDNLLNQNLKLMGYTSNKEFIEGKEMTQEIEMAQITLDHFVTTENLSNINLIKIDVDGSEMQVLMGMQQALAQFSPMVIIETNNPDVITCMSQQGYSYYQIKGLELSAEPMNIFFVKKIEN